MRVFLCYLFNYIQSSNINNDNHFYNISVKNTEMKKIRG